VSHTVRYILVIALTATGYCSLAQAQMDHSSHGAATTKPATGMADSAMEEGVVKKVDKNAGKVAIAHAAQKNGMPAMTMVYKVKDTVLLEQLQAGQKIRFVSDSLDASMTLVRVEQVK